jgi:hypothetical protein
VLAAVYATLLSSQEKELRLGVLAAVYATLLQAHRSFGIAAFVDFAHHPVL